MYISSNIALKIKELAKAQGVVIKNMLTECDLGLNTMANLKTSMPKADSLAKIADYLNCSVDYLMGRTNIINDNVTLSKNEQLTEQERQLLLAYRQNPNMQGAVNRLLGVEQPMRAVKIARSNTSKVTEITGDFSDLFNAPRVLSDDDI